MCVCIYRVLFSADATHEQQHEDVELRKQPQHERHHQHREHQWVHLSDAPACVSAVFDTPACASATPMRVLDTPMRVLDTPMRVFRTPMCGSSPSTNGTTSIANTRGCTCQQFQHEKNELPLQVFLEKTLRRRG